jgi:GntR family transcriptional regulator
MNISPVKDKSLKEKIKISLHEFVRSIDTGINNKLPREELLAKELKVSRNTVRGVLIEMEQEGLIIRKHGRGTFVNSEALQLKVAFSPAPEFMQMIRNSGYEAKLEVLKVEIKEIDPFISKRLKIEQGDPVVCIEKLFFADENPAIYCIDRFPRKLIKEEIVFEDLNEIVYFYLKNKAGITIVRDKTEFYTTTNIENRVLTVHFKTDAVKSYLVCESVEFDYENEPTLYNHVYFDTEFIRFNQVRPKQIIY